MAYQIFIDGEYGTTGLQIREHLQTREDLELISIEENQKKDPAKRRELINDSDLTILCLPDAAARESVSLLKNNTTRILDASTAHRVNPNWVYGMAELTTQQRNLIQEAQFVANPGCYPTGFLLCVRPLIDAGILPQELALNVTGVSGYSGGGTKLIQSFEDSLESPPPFFSYGLNLNHKHLPEMKYFARQHHTPLFSPNVGAFAQGMLTSIPLRAEQLHGATPETAGEIIYDCLSARYTNEAFIRLTYLPEAEAIQRISPCDNNNTNAVDIYIACNTEGQVLLIAQFDNLGKGASLAAVQNVNLMLGCEEITGLLPSNNH